jgi:hypothetical protein
MKGYDMTNSKITMVKVDFGTNCYNLCEVFNGTHCGLEGDWGVTPRVTVILDTTVFCDPRLRAFSSLDGYEGLADYIRSGHGADRIVLLSKR